MLCSNFPKLPRAQSSPSALPGEAEDEIFRVGGTIATEERGDDFDWSPFDVSCHAAFESFEGTHHIRYSTNLHRSKTVPAWLPWKLLGAAGPIRPTYCRVGLERFQSKFTLSSVGFMPQVTDTVILDAINGTVSLQVVTDQAAWKPCNPLEETPIFSGIDRALRASAGFNLADSFREELSKAAKFPRK